MNYSFDMVYFYFYFLQSMQVFVPSYSGSRMVMLRIKDMDDFESLPLTKWNIRQPNHDNSREEATETGKAVTQCHTDDYYYHHPIRTYTV